jgi:DNA-directed RNA polymerase subunit K/omega
MSDSEQELSDGIDDTNLFDEIDTILNDVEDNETIDADGKNDECSDDDDNIEYEDEYDEKIPEKPKLQKIKMNTVIRAEDSRMPDVMSQFELTSLIIARATAMAKGSMCLVNVDPSIDPVKKAKIEIIKLKSNRSVLRVDIEDNHHEWKLRDFAYFPANSIEELEQLKTLAIED